MTNHYHLSCTLRPKSGKCGRSPQLNVIYIDLRLQSLALPDWQPTTTKGLVMDKLSSELHFEVVGQGTPHVLLDVIDLLVCQAAVHGAVGDAVAVRCALLLGVREAVNENHRLRQVPGMAAHNLTQVVLCEAHVWQPEANILRSKVAQVVKISY